MSKAGDRGEERREKGKEKREKRKEKREDQELYGCGVAM